MKTTILYNKTTDSKVELAQKKLLWSQWTRVCAHGYGSTSTTPLDVLLISRLPYTRAASRVIPRV